MIIIKEILIQLIIAFVLHEIGYWMYGRKDVFGRISTAHLISGILIIFSVISFFIIIYFSYLGISKIILY